jgi:hypothetical protein
MPLWPRTLAVASAASVIAQVHDRLRGVPGWLLIFDNADAAEDIRAWLPGGPLPPGIPGHVTVTTRRGGFSVLGHVMELDVIDLPSAITLLLTRVRDLPEDAGQEIARELGQLPLALEQAAAPRDDRHAVGHHAGTDQR